MECNLAAFFYCWKCDLSLKHILLHSLFVTVSIVSCGQDYV